MPVVLLREQVWRTYQQVASSEGVKNERITSSGPGGTHRASRRLRRLLTESRMLSCPGYFSLGGDVSCLGL